MRVLITGGAGFIGHHVAVHFEKFDHEVVTLDRLDVSGNLNRLNEAGFQGRTVFHDLKAPINDLLAAQLGQFDWIVHIAAATHVDRSIADPLEFVMDNVVGTCNILDFAVSTETGRFLYFSTDEVFGPAPVGVAYKEWDRYMSGNPYAATKAGAEELVLSFSNTYRLPVIITHTMNVIGERQHPEKFVPMTIKKLLDDEQIMVHCNADLTRSSSRFYIHVENIAGALHHLLTLAEGNDVFPMCDKFNIVGDEEVFNDELVGRLSQLLASKGFVSRSEVTMVDFHSSRPGHDLRYALDGAKMKGYGWDHPLSLADGLDRIVDFCLANAHWIPDVTRPRRSV